MSEMDFLALLTTLKLASISTVILLLLGTPLAWWLSRTRCRLKVLIEAVIALPLILPPTVLGFYLLISLGPNGVIGSSLINMGGEPLAFTFTGLIVGSIIYSLPFVVQPLQNAFSSIGKRPLELASTLGANAFDRFVSVVLPLSKAGFITATVMGFAHTIGEFGVVLMIGGNIPGETQVLSIAIYDHVESLEYTQAHLLAGGLLISSFIMLITVYYFNHNSNINKNVY
jgi:molybdate transport system permease protein